MLGFIRTSRRQDNFIQLNIRNILNLRISHTVSQMLNLEFFAGSCIFSFGLILFIQIFSEEITDIYI